MGRVLAITGTIVVLAILVTLLVVWLAKLGHKERAAEKGWALKGDLTKGQEEQLLRELASAASIFEAITGRDGRFDDMSYLQSKHQERVTAWLQDYHKRGTT